MNPEATWYSALCIAVEAGALLRRLTSRPAGSGYRSASTSPGISPRAASSACPFRGSRHPDCCKSTLEGAGAAFGREVRGGGVDFRGPHLHWGGDRSALSSRPERADRPAVLVEKADVQTKPLEDGEV